MSSVQLPSNLNLYGIAPARNGLLLTGDTTRGACAFVRVAQAPLRITAHGTTACSRTSAEPVHPVLAYDRKNFNVRVRIARGTREGPVVMTFQQVSDTQLEWAYGPNTLWLFDTATTHGAEVMQISATTGRIENVVRMPRIFRPVLAADDDGLWLAIAPNGGYPDEASTRAPIYHVAPGTRTAVVVHYGGRAALWIVAAGHAVWADVLTGQDGAEIWRFDGASGTAHALASARGLNSWAAGVNPRGPSIWAVREVPVSRKYFSCSLLRVIRINGRTGKQSLATDIPTPGSQCYGVTYGTFAGGAFWFLDGPRLYRVAA